MTRFVAFILAMACLAGAGRVPAFAGSEVWEPPYFRHDSITGCTRDAAAECEMEADADRLTGELRGEVKAVAPFEGRVPGYSAAWAMSTITHRHDVTASATNLSYEIDILLRSVEVAHTGLLTNTVGEPFGGVSGVQFSIGAWHQGCGCGGATLVDVLRTDDDGDASIEDQQITIRFAIEAPEAGIPAGSIDVNVHLRTVVNIEGLAPDTGEAFAAASATVTSIRLDR